MINNKRFEELHSNPQVLYMYEVGDFVYKTPASLHDIIVIVQPEFQHEDNEIDSDGDPCYFKFYYIADWFTMIEQNKLLVWECSSLKKKYVHKEHVRLLVKRNDVELRKSIIQLCDDHWNVFLHGVNTEYDREAKKQLWRAIKASMFALQIMVNWKITNFEAATGYYEDIISSTNSDVKYYEKKYKSIIDQNLQELRDMTANQWLEHIKQQKRNEQGWI